MPQVIFNIGTKSVIVTATAGTRLIDLMHHYQIDAGGSCGGNGTCKKCRVYIMEPARFALACDTIVTNDITVVVKERNGFGIMAGNQTVFQKTDAKGFGIAIDIGTTTIAFYLYDLKSGEKIDSASMLNPQSIYGADVISRIEKCMLGYLPAQKALITQAVNAQIGYWKQQFSIHKISKMVFAGNTTMMHIAANTNPASIGKAPYTPVFLESRRLDSIESGYDAEEIILLPSISAFIGSDLSAGMLSSGMTAMESALLIDLGTNGEIIFKNGNSYYGCSTATGPAFEGANIENGIGGIEGAITKVGFDGEKMIFQTIGPNMLGISGTGLVDLVTLLVHEGLIDESGAFNPNSHSCLQSKRSEDRFYLSANIWLSQKDIRQFQLAKSAIRAGIESLLQIAKCPATNIQKIYVAGGFGFYLDIDHAIEIGMFPAAFKGKVESIGNASGTGAIRCLLDANQLPKCEQLALSVKTIDLMKYQKFTDLFVENMGF